ncbi:ribonucleotide-diphosphate reductase subunit alpha [Salmonella phage 21]|nr:ribonucleotide-diphosphate reductase subunit alpha [Salmonella phage 21]
MHPLAGFRYNFIPANTRRLQVQPETNHRMRPRTDHAVVPMQQPQRAAPTLRAYE